MLFQRANSRELYNQPRQLPWLSRKRERSCNSLCGNIHSNGNDKFTDMKKVVLFLLGVLCSFDGYAQYIERLSNQEIIKCQTPASVAYNYTIAVLQKDFNKVLGFHDLTAHERQEIDEYLIESGNTIETLYSQIEDVNALWSWLPALDNGFEIVIADIEDHWKAKTDGGWMIDENQIVKDGMVYFPGEEKPYWGIHDIVVFVTCSPSTEINTVSFDDMTLYDDSVLYEPLPGSVS